MEVKTMSKEPQELIKTLATRDEYFNGIPIRVIIYQDKPYIPVIDIGKGIGYDRRNLSRLIDDQEDMFEGNKEYLPLKTRGGLQSTLCINRDGIISILMALRVNMVEDKSKRTMIKSFRKWAIDTLGKAMDHKNDQITPFVAPSVPAPTTESVLGQMFAEHLQIADALAKFANVDRGIAVSAAIALVEYKTGVDLTAYKGLIQRERKNDPVPLLNATDLGRELGGINAVTINATLKKLGYLEWIANSWSLTERGRRYAEVFPVVGFTDTNKSYARYQIKWQPEMVKILHKHMFEPLPDSKNGLLSGFLS
jgi:hypothetical protein